MGIWTLVMLCSTTSELEDTGKLFVPLFKYELLQLY